MIPKWQAHLAGHFPDLLQKKLLLAVSGGLDSMVMVHLFEQAGAQFEIAHCNFGLRGAESDADEAFVREFANSHKITFHHSRFDTEAFAQDFKLSIQMAARELRYNWFAELLAKKQLDYVVTAHHADDNLETALINLTRGTGPDGLLGISEQQGQVVRPLLPFSRAELETFARENHIVWREDSSNASRDYLRNRIRQQIVPILKEINPSLPESFRHTAQYLEQTISMADDASRIVYRKVVSEAAGQKKINLDELLVLPNYEAYLYRWLSPLGFTAWRDIYALAHAESGKMVHAPGFRLLRDRGFLILASNAENATDLYEIQAGTTEVNFPLKLIFSVVQATFAAPNTTTFVDADKLQFPLTLRRWQKGDVFQPSGMAGQSKKLSKFFKDEKYSLFDKENAWLLCSGEDIVWIVGKRLDERYKVVPSTQNILQITLHDDF